MIKASAHPYNNTFINDRRWQAGILSFIGNWDLVIGILQ